MKNLLILFTLLSSYACFAQTETKESFVNQVWHTEVYDTTRRYYLAISAHGIDIDSSGLFEVRIALSDKDQSAAFMQMLKNISLGDTMQVWDFSKLALALPYNNDSTRILSLFSGTQIIKEGWSKQRIKQEWKKHELAKQQAGGNLYTFSAPVFDAAYQLAAIRLSSYCGGLCAHSCIYFFKKVNGRWEKIGASNCWVS